ncbi:glycosyltransferase family 2 protein [Helicobacter suis]|uniref:glycosyltransferase family 2 protein n=1 Tax=Helicobacter suis TaxID=104628 RepID=UPI0001F7A51C|nr:glycosyltransferase family 2 protein [Helicobacter suis]EFX43421.1 Glycosyl transferase [Helicobacter suis HS1]BDR28667.1 glycosyl transferase [Helicobacter suis HS1]
MKISLITPVLNRVKTLKHTIQSVLEQSQTPYEHLIIDGGSVDGTLELLKAYPHLLVHSKPDLGLYDAMNKGIALAKGEIIGILNSDDVYAHSKVLEKIAQVFKDNPQAQMVYGDLVYVRDAKIVRYYQSGNFDPKLFFYGRVPAHPTLFVRKEVYARFGGYKIDYKIAADYEFLVRTLLKGGVSWAYLPEVLIKMGVGGVSTQGLKSLWLANKENLRACRENGIKANLLTMLLRYPYKIKGLLRAKLSVWN